MIKKGRYHVCRKCEGDWCWESELWRHTKCNLCGAKFPKPKNAQFQANGKAWQWDLEWPPLSTAAQPNNWTNRATRPANRIFGALHQVWNFIPEEAQQAIASAGFKVQPDSSTEGQGNGKGNGKPSLGIKGEKGQGKGKGYPPFKELTPAQIETAKGLFESATEEQQEVLKLMGVEQPTQPTPDLTELCRQHIDTLPESIKLLLEKQNEPEKAPTVTETSRKFKVATADLRVLILKKSTLQLKINKTKTAYTDLLLEMQQLQDTLSKQQQEVTILQQELQDRVQEDQPLTGPNLLQTLQDLGIQVSDEQAAKLAVLRFQVAATEEAKLPNEADKGPPPPPKGADDMDLESPPGLQPASKNQERNGRSRSPKGGDGDKGKAEDNKV